MVKEGYYHLKYLRMQLIGPQKHKVVIKGNLEEPWEPHICGIFLSQMQLRSKEGEGLYIIFMYIKEISEGSNCTISFRYSRAIYLIDYLVANDESCSWSISIQNIAWRKITMKLSFYLLTNIFQRGWDISSLGKSWSPTTPLGGKLCHLDF